MKPPAEADPPAAYTLRLPAPVCVAVSADGQSAAHDNVRVLALGLTPAQAAHLGEDLGQTVRLHGRLSQGAHVGAGVEVSPASIGTQTSRPLPE